MKRNNMTWAAMPIAALCLTMMATGCSKSDDVAEAPAAPFVINATLGGNNAESRATVDYGKDDESKETFKWNKDDEFQLMAKDGFGNLIKNNQSNLHNFIIPIDYVDASSNSAKFTNEEETFNPNGWFSCFAIYPANGFIENNGTIINYTVPATQTQKNTTNIHLKDNMKMYANGTGSSTGDVSLTFKHLTAMLRFTVKNDNAAACKVKSIKVTASANSVFGTTGRITVEGAGYTEDPIISNKDNAAELTLNMSDYELAAGNTVDGYALTLPSSAALTDQILTFTLTVTDTDGNNERTYTSLALEANQIITANNNATTWEAGKRYWFDLTLDDQLTVKLNSVTAMPGWTEETEI